MAIDLHKVRQDTKGCHDKIFLNNAGSSLTPTVVLDKMTAYLAKEIMNGGYETAALETADISEFYTEIGKLINCKADNIAFMYNATDAYAKAVSAIPFVEGDVILTTNDDYISNHIAFLSLQKRFKIQLIKAKNLPNGDLDLVDFEHLIQTHQPKLVAVTHIPTNSGLIQAVEAVGELCQTYNCWYIVDACQSVGQIVVDVQKIKCDFLSATGRKFLRGPRGTGFLYVSDRVIAAKLEPLFIDMRGANWTGFEEYEVVMSGKRFEEWEISYTNLIGLAAAVKYANQVGMSNIQAHNSLISRKLRNNLSKIPGVAVLDKGSNLSSIVTFHMAGISLEHLCAVLKDKNVKHAVSNKEFALIDLTQKGVDWVIRFSPHYYNTVEEIEEVCQVVREIAENQVSG